MLATKTNRMHKVLADGGIQSGAVVSDIKGGSAREMVARRVSGNLLDQMLAMAQGGRKNKREDLAASPDGNLSPRRRFVLRPLHARRSAWERQLVASDAELFPVMTPHHWTSGLLQTVPGIDEIARALIRMEIADDLSRLGDAERPASCAALRARDNSLAGKGKSARRRNRNTLVRSI